MMKHLFLTVLLILSSAFYANAQQTAKTKIDLTTLVGTWKVDLRPTPDAPAYFQTFEIKKVEGNTFTGTFYGTEIKNGRFNQDWETVYMAFTSEDNSGFYNHFAKLVGTRLEGASHSLGRNFLLPWRADREVPTQIKPKAASSKKSRSIKNKKRA